MRARHHWTLNFKREMPVEISRSIMEVVKKNYLCVNLGNHIQKQIRHIPFPTLKTPDCCGIYQSCVKDHDNLLYPTLESNQKSPKERK